MSSCLTNKKDKIIASVNKKELLFSDVILDMPIYIEDSIYFVEKFINDWIRKEIMLSHAELNLNTDLLKYQKQIENYRASLLIFEYQQQLLNQNFDTIITLSEIKEYYDKYKDEFKLSKNIFKGRFIVIDKSAPNLYILDKRFDSDSENSKKILEDYCQQFSNEYYIKSDKWQFFSTFNNKLPVLIKDEDFFLKNTKGVYFEDKDFRYYVFINEFKLNGSISPLEIEKEKIMDVLLNKKKIDYLKQLEDDLLQNALANKKIKIY